MLIDLQKTINADWIKRKRPIQKEAKSKIRGDPIPDHEAERGARVTRNAVLAEQELWGKIPELAALVERDESEKPS